MSDRIFKYEPLWGEWSVGQLIGEGVLSEVYRITKLHGGIVQNSLAKIIHIPPDDQETISLETSSGNGIVESIKMASSRFASSKPIASVVNYINASAFSCDSGGWDIILQMEDLLSLDEYLAQNTLSAREAIKLAQEIANALILFSKANAVHGAINPASVYIAKHKSAKVAFLGIDSILRHEFPSMYGSLQEKLYMAPEGALSPASDIYSLGLLIYRILNAGRLPFVEESAGSLSYAALEKAVEMRFSGEAIPKAAYCESGVLEELLSSMLSFSFESRLSSPAILKEALSSLYMFEPSLDMPCEQAIGGADYARAMHLAEAPDTADESSESIKAPLNASPEADTEQEITPEELTVSQVGFEGVKGIDSLQLNGIHNKALTLAEEALEAVELAHSSINKLQDTGDISFDIEQVQDAADESGLSESQSDSQLSLISENESQSADRLGHIEDSEEENAGEADEEALAILDISEEPEALEPLDGSLAEADLNSTEPSDSTGIESPDTIEAEVLLLGSDSMPDDGIIEPALYETEQALQEALKAEDDIASSDSVQEILDKFGIEKEEEAGESEFSDQELATDSSEQEDAKMFELDEDRLINPELEAEYTQMSLEDAIYVAKDSSSAESLETQADGEPEALGQEAAIEGDEASETASEMHILEEIQSDLEAIELNIESFEGELPIVGSDEIEIEAESPYDQGESAEIEPETDDAGPEPTLYSFKPDWGDESESLPDTELSGPDSIAGQSIFEADEALSDFDGKSSEQAEAEEVQEAESLSGIYYSLDGEAGLGEAEETDFGISGFELSGLAGDGPDDGIQEAEAVEFVPIAEEAMLESLLPEAADEFLGLDELLPEAENPIFIQDDASEPSLIIKHDLSDSEAADTGELPGMPVLSEEFLEIELAEGIGSDQDEPGQAALLASDEFTPSLDDELEGLVGELVDEAAESLLGSFEAVDIPMSLEEAVAEVKDVLDAITAQSESDWQADSVISSDGIDSTGSIDRFIAPTLEEASNETLQTEDSFSEPEGIISPAGGTGMQPEEIELEIEPLEAIESIETEAFEILAEDSSDVPAENEIGESEDEPVKASPFELGSLADLIPEEPEAQAPAPAQTAEEILLGLLNQDTELPASIIEKIRSGERIASESPAKNGSEVIFESSDFTITRIGKAAKEGIEGESPPDTLTGQFKPLAENPSEDAASENESSESPYKDHSIPLTSVGESTQAAQPEELEPMPERRIPRNFQESVNENSAIVSLTQNENAAAIASNGEEAPREAESIYAADISDLKQQTTSPFLLGSTRQAQLSEDYDSSCDTIFYAKQEAPAISRIKTELPINDFAQTGSIYLYPNKAKEERALNAQPLVHGLSDGTEDEAIDASMPIVQLDEQAGKADWTSDEDGFKTMNLFSDIVRATDSSLPEADPITMIQASIDGADMELGLYSDSAYVTQDRQPELKKKPRMYKVASYKPMAASAETIASAAIPSSIRALRPIQTQRRPYEMLQRDTEPGLGGATAAAATMFDEDIINPTPKARNRLMEESILRRGWVKILVFVLAAALAASGFYIYRQNAKYGEALRKMNAGSYFEAKAAFEAIRNYKDSEAKAAECNTQLQSQYNNALSLYNDEQYQGAMEVFMHLGSFKDSRIYLKECQSEIKYKEAVTKLERNEFYEAYRIFTQLGEYKTSATDAQNCIQPEPETAYRIEDEAFSKGTAEEKTIVELRNPAGASNSVFIKIYDKQGKLAVTAYLQANTAVSATFLGGEYKIHAAFGTNWFGAEDVFGDEGEYSLRYIDEESDYIEMLGNYRSTQTFLSRSDSGESLKRIDRSEF